MRAEVFEEPIEFEIAILEAIVPGSPQYLASSYPYPSLVPTSAVEKRTLRSVVLENEFVRAVVLPDLGGRLISLFDKRTQNDIFSLPKRIAPKLGGARGAYVPDGVQIVATGSPRLNSLGSTSTLLEQADDDDSPAGVWVGEVAGPLSFNALWSLDPDSAVLTLEVRFLNRALHPTPYNGGLTLSVTVAGSGLTVLPFETTLVEEQTENGATRSLLRAPSGSRFLLAPRQADTWKVQLVPWSSIGHASAATEAGVLAWHADQLKIHAARRMPGHKLVLLTETQGPLEAIVDLYPETPYQVAFDRLPARPVAVALLDQEKRELLRFQENAPAGAPVSRFWDMTARALTAVPPLFSYDPDEVLRSATTSVLTRSTAHLLLGAKRLAEAKPDEADVELGEALLFNGNDPLAWWSKAVAKRMGGETGEIAELLNAHFLAPLEPALRSESFFSQTEATGKDPNPILTPLAEAPEQFVEVACLLLHHGLRADAAKFLEEALRHSDLPMLRYLLAYVVGFDPQMAVEASQHVLAASKLGFRPPYPWRDEEVAALQALQSRFPQDELIGRFLRVVPYRQVFAHNPTHGE